MELRARQRSFARTYMRQRAVSRASHALIPSSMDGRPIARGVHTVCPGPTHTVPVLSDLCGAVLHICRTALQGLRSFVVRADFAGQGMCRGLGLAAAYPGAWKCGAVTKQ